MVYWFGRLTVRNTRRKNTKATALKSYVLCYEQHTNTLTLIQISINDKAKLLRALLPNNVKLSNTIMSLFVFSLGFVVCCYLVNLARG